jgi:hypothetical protein
MNSLVHVAKEAVEFDADPAGPPLKCCDPIALLPGGVVTYMLAVAAGQIGHPVAFFIEVEAGDLTSHA